MSYLLPHLLSKLEVDYVLQNVNDLLVIIRFGKDEDPTCLHLDDILAKAAPELARMATIWLVDVDLKIYVDYFHVSITPAVLFFYNGHHIKCDYGTQDHSKWVGSFHSKQDFIDLVEVFYRGAIHGKFIVSSPIPPQRTPQYSLIYQDI